MDRRVMLAGLLALPVAGAYLAVGRREQASPRNYEWWPTTSAPREAPVFLIKGDLLLADGSAFYVPENQMAGTGWGEFNAVEVVGPDRKALPAAVSLRWFSYLDDRFYAGRFVLPTDLLETVFAHDAPLPPPRPREPFHYVIFGMAPGGHVSVWASAGPVVREIATFRAAPADLPWTDIIATPKPTRAQHVRQVLEEAQTAAQIALQRSPGRMALWDEFPRRVAWAPRLTGADPRGATLSFKGLNGEWDWADLADPRRGGEPLPPALPMPASLIMAWGPAAGRYSAHIGLDVAETVAAFRKLAAGDRREPLSLVLEPAGNCSTVDLLLRRGDLVHRFDRKTVEIYGG